MPPQNNDQIAPSVESLQNNQKLLETVKTFATYGFVVYLVSTIVNIIFSVLGWSVHYSAFNIGALVVSLIAGTIGFAIAGAIFCFLYDPIHNWVKGSVFLSRHIYDLFTLFWKPYIVGTVISAIFGLLAILGLSVSLSISAGLFIGWVISLVVHIIVYYWYSKKVSAKLAPLYPW